MNNIGGTVSRSALTAMLVFGISSAVAAAEDLSRYRNFQLGADLPTIVKQTGASLSQAKVIHRRPVLIQELLWRPRGLGPSSQPEPAKEILFSFYDGELFRIAIDYDRYETEGMTAEDFVEAISETYGVGAKPAPPANAARERYGDEEEVLARWQDSQFRFDLVRLSYGPSYKLIGLLRRLEAPAQAAILEANRLDDQEAPQRNAARIASEEEATRAKLEKARLLNKPKFRP